MGASRENPSKDEAKQPEPANAEAKSEAKAVPPDDSNVKHNFGTENHYDILGLAKTATETEIKKSYRRLAVKHHPDKNASSPESTANFKRLEEAYSVLINPVKRSNYDDKLQQEEAKAAAPPPEDKGPPPENKASPPENNGPPPDKSRPAAAEPQASSETPQEKQTQSASGERENSYSGYFNSDCSFDAAGTPSRGNVQSRSSVGQKDQQYKPHRMDSDPNSQHQVFRQTQQQILKALFTDLVAIKDFIDQNQQGRSARSSLFSSDHLNLPSLSTLVCKIGKDETRISQCQSQYGAEDEEKFNYGVVTSCQDRSATSVKQSINIILPKEVEKSLKEEKNLAESKMYQALVFDVADKVVKGAFKEAGCSTAKPPQVNLILKDGSNPTPLELAHMQAAILNDCPCTCKNKTGEVLNVDTILKSKGLRSDKAAITEARDQFKQSLEAEKKVDITMHFR